jgi:hypothetical protein
MLRKTKMKAGFFETDITPPYGMERAGSYRKITIAKILTPLKVRAAVFDNGKTQAAFAGIDACMIDSAACDDACEIVEKTCGIPRKNIMIAASHTHSGGAVNSLSDFSLNKETTPPDIYDLAVNKSAQPDPHFRDIVIKQLASAIIWAYENAEEALINFGSSSESRYVFNRRFRMKDGRTCTHPGKMNPEIVCPAGPIDPEVGVLGAWRKNGSLLGCVVNYACHGTVISSGTASADWIHYMQCAVKKIMGENSVAVFLNGASGDVTQVNNLSYEVSSGPELAFKLGTRVGAEVVKVLNENEPREYNTIDTQWKTLKIDRRPISAETLRKNKEILNSGISEDETKWTFAKEKIVYNYAYSQKPVADVNCQAIQIGNALFVSNPSEYFCQLGLDIKEASEFKYTFVVSLANGCVGYVPTPESFKPSGGGYETIISSYSNLEINAGTKIAETCINFSKNAKEETLSDPYANKIPAQKVWEYGAYPPELE